MLWLDGACGAKADGKPVQDYDFERIWNTALELQPNIVMSGCAPDVRWIGNESGKTRESEWNVVPKFQYDRQNFAVNCQTDDDMKAFQKRCQDVMLPDMSSREFLSKFDEFMWYPAEVGVFCIKKFKTPYLSHFQDLKKQNSGRLFTLKLTKIALHIHKNLSREDAPLGLVIIDFTVNFQLESLLILMLLFLRFHILHH